MDRLTIIHSTSYRYAEPVAFARHRLVVRPREGHDLHVESMHLEISPAHQIYWHRDLFGNSVANVQFLEKSDVLAIRNEVTVTRRTGAIHASFSDFAPVPYPAIYRELEKPVAGGYLLPVYFSEFDALREWVQRLPFWQDCKESTELVGALNAWIYQNINYRRREEKGVQTPLETLRLGSGSCRDMATLMLEGLRAAGIAARFASGYLDSVASAAGRAATHAWLEAYFPEVGWCGCDPTINEIISHKHILTGVSSHPRGVMPVSGSYLGAAELYLGMEVSVKMEKLADEGLPAAAG